MNNHDKISPSFRLCSLIVRTLCPGHLETTMHINTTCKDYTFEQEELKLTKNRNLLRMHLHIKFKKTGRNINCSGFFSHRNVYYH